MSFQKVCSKDDLWEGEMEIFEVGGREVLVIHLPGGEVRAIPPGCPHQDQPLVEGTLEGTVLTCRAHLWRFDVATGNGVNPADCKLVQFPVKVEGDDVYVDLEED
jgi:toluene monooxygenase system ferredoxin subunit